MTGTPVRVFLARHGETEWNVQGRWQGHYDSQLTELGLQQAEQLADALAGEKIQAVYSSDLERARVTAEKVALRHGLHARVDVRLREIDTGAWTGRLGSDIAREDPELMEAWRHRPWSVRPPGGESIEEAQRRNLDFFDTVLPTHAPGGTVVIVTHGTVAHCILAQAMRRPLTDIWLKEGRIGNCHVAHLEWTEGDGLRLVDFGNTSHLGEFQGISGWRVVSDGDETAATDARKVAR